MGTTEAYLSAAACSFGFFLMFGLTFYFWRKHTSRHNNDVMLECAQKAGGAAAVQAIREELQLDADGPLTRESRTSA